MSKTGIILVAAGESKRLGRPKQLLPFRGTTLLRHAAQTAVSAGIGPVVVVLGARNEECRKTLDGLQVNVVVNQRWEEGIGTSIAIGMNAILTEDPEGVIVMLCDQPCVSVAALKRLELEQSLTNSDIIASSYDGTAGPPALFMSCCFDELLALRGAQGAKALLADTKRVALVAFPEGGLDVDEPGDLPALARLENG